jgi:hypothetical protein
MQSILGQLEYFRVPMEATSIKALIQLKRLEHVDMATLTVKYDAKTGEEKKGKYTER